MGRFEGLALDQSLERAGDGVCAIGGDGKIVLWNRSAERILGYTAHEVLGRPCCDVFAGRDDNDNRLCYPGCQVQALVSAGDSVQSFDMRTRTKAGQPVWLNVSILSVRNGGPGGSLTLHFFRDVSASKELLLLVHERLAVPSSDAAPAVLSRREIEVLRMVAAGMRTREAAERLHVSAATVRNHVQNILTKLGVHSRLEAVAYANRHRLL
jgi:PAS domain S-box-containing protein